MAIRTVLGKLAPDKLASLQQAFAAREALQYCSVNLPEAVQVISEYFGLCRDIAAQFNVDEKTEWDFSVVTGHVWLET